MYKCPACHSTNVLTERRPNGDSECKDCGNKEPTRKFINEQSSMSESFLTQKHNLKPCSCGRCCNAEKYDKLKEQADYWEKRCSEYEVKYNKLVDSQRSRFS